MARLLPDLASFLSSVLPRGFALGPSLLREGSVGLWWVGRPLEAGAPLGTEGDAQRVARTGSDPLSNSSENDQSGAACSEDEKVKLPPETYSNCFCHSDNCLKTTLLFTTTSMTIYRPENFILAGLTLINQNLIVIRNL